jgi:hypothetical protein
MLLAFNVILIILVMIPADSAVSLLAPGLGVELHRSRVTISSI